MTQTIMLPYRVPYTIAALLLCTCLYVSVKGVMVRELCLTEPDFQITGGHKYVPPRQDTNAPDLYVPFMAVCTYIVLKSVSQTLSGRFTHDNMYVTVSDRSFSLRGLTLTLPKRCTLRAMAQAAVSPNLCLLR